LTGDPYFTITHQHLCEPPHGRPRHGRPRHHWGVCPRKADRSTTGKGRHLFERDQFHISMHIHHTPLYFINRNGEQQNAPNFQYYYLASIGTLCQASGFGISSRSDFKRFKCIASFILVSNNILMIFLVYYL
jgi:hypothetical protein